MFILKILFPFILVYASDLKFDIQVERFNLENGLTVLLHKDQRLPLISYHTWYRVGSRDEAPGITGAAHMLEHMMFQGSKKYTSEQLHQILDERGIRWNAFTSYDYTGFYMNLHKQDLDLVIEVELDRMQNLLLAEKNLISEREVVKEERRMRIENNPFGKINETKMSNFYAGSSYEWPVIGHMRDIEKYDLQTLRYFYQKYYHANNAVLVIVGDIDVETLKQKIIQKYSILPKKDKPQRDETFVKAAKMTNPSASFKEYESEIQNKIISVSFPGVSLHHQDLYALDILGAILGGGSSSRLYQDLVSGQKLATSVQASSANFDGVGRFEILIQTSSKVKNSVLLKRLERQMSEIQMQKVLESELKKVKTEITKNFVESLMTIDGKAYELASLEITRGDYRVALDDYKKYQSVTAADIQNVAQKFLDKSKRLVLIFNEKSKK